MNRQRVKLVHRIADWWMHVQLNRERKYEKTRASFKVVVAALCRGISYPASWSLTNKGKGIQGEGKNAIKRANRAAYVLDRLAMIRFWRETGNYGHVPKYKRVPQEVFE